MVQAATKTARKKRARKKKGELVTYEQEMLGKLRDGFAAAYLDPLSPSHGKVMPSAIKAGFAVSYARNLTVEKPMWLQEILGKSALRHKAKENLQNDLDLDPESIAMSFGKPIREKDGTLVKKLNARLLEVRQKATFFTLEKLDPDFVEKPKEQKGGDTILNKLEFNIIFPDNFVPPEPRYVESEVVEEVVSDVITESEVITSDSSELITKPKLIKRFTQGQQIIEDMNLQIPEDTRVIDERTVGKPKKNIKKMLREVLDD